MVADKGLSPKTVNAYRQVACALGAWAVKPAKLLKTDPVAEINKRHVQTDIRKERRSLTVDEAYRL